MVEMNGTKIQKEENDKKKAEEIMNKFQEKDSKHKQKTKKRGLIENFTDLSVKLCEINLFRSKSFFLEIELFLHKSVFFVEGVEVS